MLYKSSRYMIMWWTTLMMFDTGCTACDVAQIMVLHKETTMTLLKEIQKNHPMPSKNSSRI